MVDSDSNDIYNSYITKVITDIPITVTLSTLTKDIGIENKDSAPAAPCDNQVSLETELTALKSFVVAILSHREDDTRNPGPQP